MSTPASTTPKPIETPDNEIAKNASVLNGVKTTAAKPGRKTAPKPASKAPAKAAPAKAATPRKALTPKERAAKPVTATIADYVAQGPPPGHRHRPAGQERPRGLLGTRCPARRRDQRLVVLC